MAPNDIEGVLALQRECFPALSRRPAEEVERKLRALYLESPLCADGLSQVARDESGRVVGFRGYVVRGWSLRGRPVRSGTGTGVCVAPELRGRGVARSLVRAGAEMFEARPSLRQTLVFLIEDRYSTDGLGLGTSLGDEPLEAYAFRWSRSLAQGRLRKGSLALRRGGLQILRRSRSVVQEASWRELPAALRLRLHSLGRRQPETGPASLEEASLTPAHLREVLCALGQESPLHLDEKPEALDWLFDYLADYPSRGVFTGRTLHRDGVPVGFFAGFLSGRRFEVLAFGALRGSQVAARHHLFDVARSLGARSAVGRASVWELHALLESGASLALASPAGVYTASDGSFREINDIFRAGDALLTGLEGEAWI